MADKRSDGGPAFPRFELDSGAGGSVGGMSLRDWFAGQALAGILANPAWNNRPDKVDGEEERAALAHADAMLKERAK